MTKIRTGQIALTSRQTGWGYVTNPGGSATANTTVTFPTAFGTAPKVTVTSLGYKTGGAPTAVSDFTGVYSPGGAVPISYLVSIGTTGFTVYIQSVSGNFGASYNGFTWIAEV